MSTALLNQLRTQPTIAAAAAQAVTIDPERLKRFIDLIVQVLPFILALFAKTPTPPAPPPVQAAASIVTIDGLLEYVATTIELRKLSPEQQQIVMNAVDALAAFLALAQ